ncbi:hypothetical protein DFH28DRAFT_943331, partial [Melampsora americana]
MSSTVRKRLFLVPFLYTATTVRRQEGCWVGMSSCQDTKHSQTSQSLTTGVFDHKRVLSFHSRVPSAFTSRSAERMNPERKGKTFKDLRNQGSGF